MKSFSILKYRFGFFAGIAGASTVINEAPLKGWSVKRFGELVVHAHPEAEVKSIEGCIRSLVIIGTMYSVDGCDINILLDELSSDEHMKCPTFLMKVSGRFALFAMEKNGDVSVYHDAFGSRSLFYSELNPGYVASHAGLLAEVLNIAKDKKVTEFLSCPEYKARTVKYLPGDLTLWVGVHPVIPNNSLNLKSTKCVRYWPVEARRIGDYNAFFHSFDLHIQGLIKGLVDRSVIFGITGGIDTRAVFAAMYKYHVEFSGITWLGGYIEEREIAPIKKIAEIMHISHKFIDVKGEYELEISEIAGINSGGYRGKSRLAALMHTACHSKNGVFVPGYGGEIIRGFYNLSKKPMSDFSSVAMMTAYGSSMRKISPSIEYSKFVQDAFEQYRIRANYEQVENFGFEPSDIFYWEHRMGVWGSTMLNEFDTANYALVGMNGRDLYEHAFSLEKEERLTKKILARVVGEYSDEIKNVPYF